MNQNLPIILIEVVLVFGGTLAFGWWQLRELKKLRQERERREAETREKDYSPNPSDVRAAMSTPSPQTIRSTGDASNDD